MKEANNIGRNKDITLICGDCLEEMKQIPDGSIDLILSIIKPLPGFILSLTIPKSDSK